MAVMLTGVELDVIELMTVFQQEMPKDPAIPSDEVVALRANIIKEEVEETLVAMGKNDLVGIADGIVDSVVVLVGTALAYGIPFTEIWNAIHASNMAKADPVTGLVIKREDGKVLKSPGWKSPTEEIHALLGIPL